jgi:hypothetical protein
VLTSNTLIHEFFFLVSWGGVRLSPLGTSDIVWRILPAPDEGHVGFVVDKVAFGQVFSEDFVISLSTSGNFAKYPTYILLSYGL